MSKVQGHVGNINKK